MSYSVAKLNQHNETSCLLTFNDQRVHGVVCMEWNQWLHYMSSLVIIHDTLHTPPHQQCKWMLDG